MILLLQRLGPIQNLRVEFHERFVCSLFPVKFEQLLIEFPKSDEFPGIDHRIDNAIVDFLK